MNNNISNIKSVKFTVAGRAPHHIEIEKSEHKIHLAKEVVDRLDYAIEFSEPTMTEVIMPDGEKQTVGVVKCHEKPVYTQAMSDASNLPVAGADCRYKLIGGVNWFDCRVIHYNNSHVWIDNLTTGSCPLIKVNTLLFIPPKSIRTGEDKDVDDLKKLDTFMHSGDEKQFLKQSRPVKLAALNG